MMCRCLQNLTQMIHSLAADVLRCTGAKQKFLWERAAALC